MSVNKNEAIFLTTREFELHTKLILINGNSFSPAINSHYNSVGKITLHLKFFKRLFKHQLKL